MNAAHGIFVQYQIEVEVEMFCCITQSYLAANASVCQQRFDIKSNMAKKHLQNNQCRQAVCVCVRQSFEKNNNELNFILFIFQFSRRTNNQPTK